MGVAAMKWSTAVAAIAIIGNVLLAYRIVDQAVTVDHLGASVTSHERREATLSGLLVGVGRSATRPGVMEFARRTWPDAIVKLDSTSIEVDDVRLEFEAGGSGIAAVK